VRRFLAAAFGGFRFGACVNIRLAGERVIRYCQLGFLQAFDFVAQTRRRLKFEVCCGLAHLRFQPFNMTAQIAAQQRRLGFFQCLAHAIGAGRSFVFAFGHALQNIADILLH